MTPEQIGIIGIAALVALLALRMPVAVAMIVVSTAGYAYIVRPAAALAKLGADPFGSASSYTLSVIPLFVLMGLFLSNARLGSDLYAFVNTAMGRWRGGMAMATIGASALFSAVSGSAVGTASTISAVAVPEMRKYEYDEGLAAGCAAVGGTLGILIPPSSALVLYGMLTEEPIGKVLIAGIVPGLFTALLLMGTVYLLVLWRPHLAPPSAQDRHTSVWAALKRTWAVPVIFGISMGGIYGGVFTPTEAGGVGAFLSLAFAVLTRRLNWRGFVDAVSQATRITAMIFLMVIGGKMFGSFLAVTRIPMNMTAFIRDLSVDPWVVMVVVFAVYFVLGAFMDEMATLVVMTPIMYPIVIGLGYDGVWFGVLTILMLLTGFLTPPVGIIGFVVASITEIPLMRVFRGVTPFWITLIIAGLVLIAFPQIALFLPNLMR